MINESEFTISSTQFQQEQEPLSNAFPQLNDSLDDYWNYFQSMKQTHWNSLQKLQQTSELSLNTNPLTQNVQTTTITAYQQLIDLIYSAQANPDKQLRVSAEKTLMLIRQQNPVQHCEDALIAIAIESNLTNLAYAVTYTNSHVRSLKSSSVFSNDTVLLSLLSLLFISVNNPLLTEKQLKSVCACVPQMLDLSCSGQQPDIMMMVVLREVELRFEAENSSNNNNNPSSIGTTDSTTVVTARMNKRFVYIGLRVVEEILLDVFQNEKLKEVFIALLKKLSSIVETLGQQVFSDLLNPYGAGTISCNQSNIIGKANASSDLEANLEILKMAGHVLSISMQRISNQKSQMIRVFLENATLIKFFADVIAFDFNTVLAQNSQQAQQEEILPSHAGISLIAIDLFDSHDRQKLLTINGIKFNSMKSLSVMNNFYLLQEAQAQRLGYDTLGLQNAYLGFLNSYEAILLHLCKQVQLCVSRQDHRFIKYIYEEVSSSCAQNIDFAIVLISDSVADAKLYKFFAQNYPDIFHEILLSLVCSNIRDYASFADEEDDEFLRLEQDLYNNRQSDILKTNGCSLVFRLAEHIDGFLSYVINFVVKTIDRIATSSHNNNNNKYAHTLFFQLDVKNQIESCLLLLIILAPLVALRKDLLEMVKSMLERRFKSFLSHASGISEIRCSALVSHYSSYLFSEYDKSIQVYVSINTQLLSEMMSFLLDELKSQGKQAKAIGMVVDTLWKLINCPSIRGSIESVMSELIPSISQLILVCQSEYFFDFVMKVISNHLAVLRHYAPDILKNLCARVHDEHNIVSVSSIKSTLLISKCLSCIVEFTNDQDVMNDFYVYIEEPLVSILKYLDTPCKTNKQLNPLINHFSIFSKIIIYIICTPISLESICFEDELSELGTILLRYLNDYEEISDIICRNLENLHRKNCRSVSSSGQFYLLLIELFKREFLTYSRPEILCGMFRLCYDSIQQLNLSNLSCDYSEFLSACFLIQYGLQSTHPVFDSTPIVSECLAFLCGIYHYFDTDSPVYPVKYIQIFLILLSYKATDTIHYMVQANIFEHFISQLEITYLTKYLDHAYNRKVLFLGVNAIIQSINQNQSATNLPQQSQQQSQEQQAAPSNEELLILRLLRILMNGLNWNQDKNKNLTHPNSKEGIVKIPQIDEIAVENRPKLADDDNWLFGQEEGEYYDITVSDLEAERLHNFYYRPERDFYPKIEQINPPMLQSDEYTLFRETLSRCNLVARVRAHLLTNEERMTLDNIERAQIVHTAANQFEVRQIKKVKRRLVEGQTVQLQQQQILQEQGMQVEGDNSQQQSPFQYAVNPKNIIFDDTI